MSARRALTVFRRMQRMAFHFQHPGHLQIQARKSSAWWAPVIRPTRGIWFLHRREITEADVRSISRYKNQGLPQHMLLFPVKIYASAVPLVLILREHR